MVDWAPGYAEKFEDTSGTQSYSFPQDDYGYEAAQALRVADAVSIGADYAHDHLGGLRWAKGVGEEAVRFAIWGADADTAMDAFDDCARRLLNIGRGKLFVLFPDGSRRWCWAKVVERPSYMVEAETLFKLAVAVRLRRYSDWYSTTATTGSQVVNATPTSWTITNAGNTRVTAAVFRLRSSGATGFTNPRLENVTTGEQIDSSRDAASANDELKIDCGRMQVLRSTDDGATYSDDYANVTLPATQVDLLTLEPGDNTIRYTDGGTPSLTIEWSFYPQWH